MEEEADSRVKLRKWNAVALWTYSGGSTDTCAICRNELTDHCPECQLNADATAAGDCTVVWGSCNHVFHSHCISRWLKTKNNCALCSVDWEVQKIGH